MALKVRKEIACKQTQAEIPDKQVCLLGIIFEIANSRDQLWKTVRLNSFQKP